MPKRLLVLVALVGIASLALAVRSATLEPEPGKSSPGVTGLTKPDPRLPVIDHRRPEITAEQDAIWYTPQRVTWDANTDYTDYSNQHKVVRDASGAIHAVWYNLFSPYQVIYKRSTDGGTTWVDSTNVSSSYSTTYNRYPSMALDSAGTVHVVWMNGTSSSAYYQILHRSRSSGGVWSATTVLYPTTSLYYVYAPDIACSPNGNIHVVWQGRYSSTSSYYISYRERIGVTWQAEIRREYDTYYKYYPSIAAGRNNNVHIVYRAYHSSSPSYYQACYIERVGTTWQAAVNISNATSSHSSIYPSVACHFSTYAPHVVWQSYPSPYRIVHIYRSGVVWQTPDTISEVTNTYTQYEPEIASGRDQTMHVVWRGYSTASPSYYQIRYATRSVAGVWSPPENVTPTANYSRFDQSIMVDSLDRFHITYYDNSAGNNEVFYVNGRPPYANDMSCISIDSIWPFQPRGASAKIGATVQNKGSNQRPAGVRVILAISGPASYSYRDTVLTTQLLTQGQTEALVFTPNWAVPTVKGPYRLDVFTDLAGDENIANDSAHRNVYVYPGLYETFTPTVFPPPDWDTIRISGTYSGLWRRTPTYYYTTPGAAYFYSYYAPAGNVGALQSMRLDLTKDATDSLIFYFYHPPYSGLARDSMQISVSTDNGSNWTELGMLTGVDTPYNRKAYSLEGVTQTNQCRIRFTGYSQGDHYMDVDDIMGPEVWIPTTDVALLGYYDEPSYPLVDGGNDTITLWAKNVGLGAVGSFNVYLEANGTQLGSTNVSGLGIGESTMVTLGFTPAPADTRLVFLMYHDLAGDERRDNDTATGLNDWCFPVGTYKAMGFDWKITTWPPTDWDTLNVDGGDECWDWYYGTNYHSGTSYTICYYESSILRNDDWLVSDALQPVAANLDSVGFYYKANSTVFIESVEVFVMSGQNVTDTLARIWAGSTHGTTGWYCVRLGLDAYDGQTIYVGIRSRGLDELAVYVDDIWFSAKTLYDVGVASINAPVGNVRTNTVVTPEATVQNFDPVAAPQFRVWFIMNDPTDVERYREFVDVPGLGGNAQTTVSFPGFDVGAVEGTWTTRCSLYLAGDKNAANDFIDGSFVVAARPPFPDGWVEAKNVPGTTPVKDGGCLAVNAGNELVYLVKGNKSLEFYSYDPLADSFSSLADIPAGAKPPKKGCDAIADGSNYVYLTKGNNTLEFWRYDIAGNLWESLPPVPIGPNRKGCKKGTDLSYVTGLDADYVYLLKGYGTEFYRYNVSAGAWDPALNDVPVGGKAKVDEGSWLCWDEATTLYFLKAKYNEFWAYDLGTATWGTAPLPQMPFIHPQVGKKKKAKDGGAGALYDGLVYALKGGNTCEFWKYNPADSWTGIDTMPQVGSTGKKKRVKTGGDLVSWGSGVFFGLKGNKTLEFWRYLIPEGPFGSRPERSGVMAGRVDAQPLGVVVAPNPLSSGFATVRYSLPKAGLMEVSILDVTGRCIHTRSLVHSATGSLALDLRSLSAGVYLVRLESDSYTVTRKLVIER